MGGYYYTTKAGDMWDYISWTVYGTENFVGILMEAPENKKHLETYIFSQGERIWCPYVEEEIEEAEMPDWRDDE